MKLFRKKDKTNNSLMTLLKKLKRHDTMVVAIAVVIALMLCGGLIYISTPVVAAEAKEEFIESERENNELTKEKLQEIRDYLDELDKVVTNNQNSLSSINEKTGSLNTKDALEKSTDHLHTQSEKIKSDTEKLIVETERITNTIDEKVTALDGKLGEVHKDIESTATKIEELEKEFSESSKRDADEIKKSFDQVGSDLEKIQKQYEEASKQAKSLSDELSKQMKDQNDALSKDVEGKYTDLLAKLDEMYRNMESFNTSAFEGFRNDINALSSSLTKQIEDIDQDILDYSTTVNNKFDEMNSSVSNKFDTVNNKFETINNNVVTDIDELRSFIQGEMNGLNGQLQQVFQSVSDGKKLLASTLLTKGVNIREDATFYEISKAIEGIESKVIIEKLEGSVVYDRHYHTGANGERIDETIVGTDQKGGCFTTPVYHTHVSSCYRTSSHLVYSTAARTHIVSPAGDINGVSAYNYKCDNCGATFRGTNGWHNESANSMDQVRARGGENVRTVYNTSIVCGKNSSTIDGYAPSCGYLIGQILAAHIDYSGNKNISPEAAASIGTSHIAVTSSKNLAGRTMIDFDSLMADFEGVSIPSGQGLPAGEKIHIHEGGNFFDENCPDCIKNDSVTAAHANEQNGPHMEEKAAPDKNSSSQNPATPVNGGNSENAADRNPDTGAESGNAESAGNMGKAGSAEKAANNKAVNTAVNTAVNIAGGNPATSGDNSAEISITTGKTTDKSADDTTVINNSTDRTTDKSLDKAADKTADNAADTNNASGKAAEAPAGKTAEKATDNPPDASQTAGNGNP
ncbi:MAG: hypothetical protein IJJ64_10470 [Butyrivibrio sp.]|nr:hypothetical protein [Butyrivibrio sp.]